MTLSQKKIQKIIDLWLDGNKIEWIAKAVKCVRNTVKKYLRLYGLLPYSYSSLQHGGSPSLVYRSIDPINHEQNQIKELTDELQMTYELGGNLTRAFDKANCKVEQKDQEIAELKQRNTQLTSQLDEVDGEKQNLTEQLDQEKKKTRDMTDKFEAEKREKEGLQKTVNEQKDIKGAMKQDHQRELEEQKTTIEEKKNNEILKIKEEFCTIMEERNYELATAKNDYNLLTKKHTKITEENRQLKHEVWSLNLKQSNSFLKYTIVYLGGVGTGLLAHYGAPVPDKQFFSPKVEYKKNTGTPIIPILTRVSIQPDIQSISSGMTPDTNTASTLCSRTCPNTSGDNTGAEYALVPNQQENIIPADSNNDVSFVTNISGKQCSNAYFSSRLETIGSTSQDETPVQEPSAFQIPLNYIYIHPPSPLPDDISEVYPMKQLRSLKGIPFEIYMEKFFGHRGCPVERTKRTHDKGADLIVIFEGKKMVIQTKQRPKVGIGGIQQVFSAKEHYKVDRAIVITPGEFTKDALEEAQILGVELWDGKRLLQEIYKDQFFYLPE